MPFLTQKNNELTSLRKRRNLNDGSGVAQGRKTGCREGEDLTVHRNDYAKPTCVWIALEKLRFSKTWMEYSERS